MKNTKGFYLKVLLSWLTKFSGFTLLLMGVIIGLLYYAGYVFNELYASLSAPSSITSVWAITFGSLIASTSFVVTILKNKSDLVHKNVELQVNFLLKEIDSLVDLANRKNIRVSFDGSDTLYSINEIVSFNTDINIQSSKNTMKPIITFLTLACDVRNSIQDMKNSTIYLSGFLERTEYAINLENSFFCAVRPTIKDCLSSMSNPDLLKRAYEHEKEFNEKFISFINFYAEN